MKIHIDKTGFNIKDPERITREYWSSPENKLQSAPFTLSSDTTEMKILLDSADRYALLGPENQERVTYNKHGLKITESIEDNRLQTIEQLKERWPEVNFEINPSNKHPIYKYYSPTPGIVRTIDQWLTDKPGTLDRIILHPDTKTAAIFNINSKEKVVTLGEQILDPYMRIETADADREVLGQPIRIIEHEYTHIQSLLTTQEEIKWSTNLAQQFLQKSDKEQQDKIISAANEKAETSFQLTERNPKTSGYFRQFLDYQALEVPPGEELITYEKYKDQFREWLIKTSLEKEILNAFSHQILGTYGETLRRKYDQIAIKILDNIQEDKRLKELVKGVKKETEGESDATEKRLNEQSTILLKSLSADEPPLGTLGEISTFSTHLTRAARQKPELKTLLLKFSQLAEDNGAPAVYALYEDFLGGSRYGGFVEVETTHQEEGEEKIIGVMREGNEKQKQIRGALIQLAFDSNKISAEEYMKQTGVICKYDDCRDYVCKKYKAECCRTYHKNSLLC